MLQERIFSGFLYFKISFLYLHFAENLRLKQPAFIVYNLEFIITASISYKVIPFSNTLYGNGMVITWLYIGVSAFLSFF